MKIRQRRKKMMRYLKILFLSMLVIGLMAGSAMAASTIDDNSGNYIGWGGTNLCGYNTNYITFRLNASTIRGGTDNYINISKDGEACGLGTYGYANLAIRSNAGLAAGAKISASV